MRASALHARHQRELLPTAGLSVRWQAVLQLNVGKRGKPRRERLVTTCSQTNHCQDQPPTITSGKSQLFEGREGVESSILSPLEFGGRSTFLIHGAEEARNHFGRANAVSPFIFSALTL